MLTAACWFGQLRGFVDDTTGFGQHLRANLRANVIEDFRNGFGGAVHSFFVVSLQNSVAKHQDRDRSLERADIPKTVIDEVFTAGTAWNPKSLILYDAEDRFVRWQTDFSRAGGGTSHEVTCAEDGGVDLQHRPDGEGSHHGREDFSRPRRSLISRRRIPALTNERTDASGDHNDPRVDASTSSWRPPCRTGCRKWPTTFCAPDAKSIWSSEKRICAWQGQWLKNDICLDSLRHYEFKTGTRYDWILRLRTDYVWPLPLSSSWHARQFVQQSSSVSSRSSSCTAADAPEPAKKAKNAVLTSVGIVTRTRDGIPDVFAMMPGPATSSVAAHAFFYVYREFEELCLNERPRLHTELGSDESPLAADEKEEPSGEACHVCTELATEAERSRRRLKRWNVTFTNFSGAASAALSERTILVDESNFGMDDGSTLLANRIISPRLFSARILTAPLFFLKTDRLSCNTLAEKCERTVSLGLTREDCHYLLRNAIFPHCRNEGAGDGEKGSEASLANMSRTFAAASMLVKAGDLPKQTTPSTPTTPTQVQVFTPPFVEKTLEVLRERLNPTDEDDGLAVPCSYNRATAVTAVTDVDNIVTNRRKVAKVGRSAVPHWLFSAFPLATLETLPAFSKENMWDAWAGFITLIEVIGAIVSALYYRPAQPFLLVENTKEGAGRWTAFAKQFLQRFFPQRPRENAFFSNSTATFKYLQRKMMPSSRNNVVIDLIITDAANIFKLPAKTVSYLHSGHKTLEEKRELQVRRFLYVDAETADGRSRNEGLVVEAQLKLFSEKLLPSTDAASSPEFRATWNIQSADSWTPFGTVFKQRDAFSERTRENVVVPVVQGYVSRTWPTLDLMNLHHPWRAREDCLKR